MAAAADTLLYSLLRGPLKGLQKYLKNTKHSYKCDSPNDCTLVGSAAVWLLNTRHHLHVEQLQQPAPL